MTSRHNNKQSRMQIQPSAIVPIRLMTLTRLDAKILVLIIQGHQSIGRVGLIILIEKEVRRFHFVLIMM